MKAHGSTILVLRMAVRVKVGFQSSGAVPDLPEFGSCPRSPFCSVRCSSRPPASVVIVPPSKRATTSRRDGVAKQKLVCVHCVIAKAAFSWLERVALTTFMPEWAAFRYFLVRYPG